MQSYNKARQSDGFFVTFFAVYATLPQNNPLQSRSCLRRYVSMRDLELPKNQLIEHDHYRRIYFSSSMRINAIALIEGFPWKTEIWQEKFPELANFLSDNESIYGKTEEDFNKILLQYSMLEKECKWLNKYLYNAIKKDISNNLPARRLTAIHVLKYTSLLTAGLILGGILF
jgi:hypothetical protein